jgi:lipid II:glycine glycyltransferase (peptidoglycan interpeptide bridge formation enzyme)
MIKILTYHEIDQQQWQELIETSPTATWFQTPEAYDFYSSNQEELMPYALGVEEDGVLYGVVVTYITQEISVLKQYFTCRAIVVGGPLLADDISDEALAALLQAIRRIGDKAKDKENSRTLTSASTPIYIESRNFNDYSKWKSIFEQSGFAYQPHYDIHVHCNAQHQMSERRQRELKRAIKNGATVAQAHSEQEIRDWYQILSGLYREKVHTPLFSEDFFLQFYRNGVGRYLLVKHQGKVIGGMMCPVLKDKAIYEWYVCGLDEDYRELYPSVVATHAAIEYAKHNEIPFFDFMGAGTPDLPYGVRDFKSEFGGKLLEYGRFLYIRKPLLYWIGKMGVKWLKRKK